MEGSIQDVMDWGEGGVCSAPHLQLQVSESSQLWNNPQQILQQHSCQGCSKHTPALRRARQLKLCRYAIVLTQSCTFTLSPLKQSQLM